MYWAVATFGPKWRLQNNRVVEIQNIDLDNPDTLAVALSKAAAVARTLKTSNGNILDVSAEGEVGSTLENIATNAENYRNLFLDKSYLHIPKSLGVLSRVDVKVLDKVSNWKGNKIPVYKDAVLLKQENINQIQGGEQFRLNTEGFQLMRNQIKE